VSTRSYLSIGDVLSLLREEFPDVTISKIRFLESQGLVNPERSPSGYRKFFEHDVERLRWVLRQQREHFLPLKVIRDRLAAAGKEGVPGPVTDVAEEPEEVQVASAPVMAGAAVLAHATLGGERLAPERPARSAERDFDLSSDLDRLGEPAAPRSVTEIGGADRGPVSPDGGNGGALGVPAQRMVVSGSGEDAGRPERQPAPVRPEGSGGSAPPPAPPPAPVMSRPARPERGMAPVTASRPAIPAERSPGTANVDASSFFQGPDPSVGTGTSMTPEELQSATGLSTEELAALESFGLLEPMVVAGALYYDEEALVAARLVSDFGRYGIEPRHLRLYRNAVDREVGLIEQIVTPLLRQRNPEARQRAEDAAADVTKLGQALRSSLLRRELRRQFGR